MSKSKIGKSWISKSWVTEISFSTFLGMHGINENQWGRLGDQFAKVATSPYLFGVSSRILFHELLVQADMMTLPGGCGL